MTPYPYIIPKVSTTDSLKYRVTPWLSCECSLFLTLSRRCRFEFGAHLGKSATCTFRTSKFSSDHTDDNIDNVRPRRCGIIQHPSATRNIHLWYYLHSRWRSCDLLRQQFAFDWPPFVTCTATTGCSKCPYRHNLSEGFGSAKLNSLHGWKRWTSQYLWFQVEEQGFRSPDR